MSKPPTANTARLFFTDRLRKGLAAIHSRPVTVVEGPMGYGKTTALREHLRENRSRTVWTTVLHEGTGVFWRDFCRALSRTFPHNLDVIESLGKLGYPKDAARLAMARELLLDLDFSPETMLVVDDAHHLPETNGGGMARLCVLLAEDADCFRAVFISRDEWSGKSEFSGLGKRLNAIGREALTLTAEDIREYYAAYGVMLGEKDAASLREATGGWISALSLYLPRFSRKGVFSRPAAINTLLENELFSLLPEEIRDLLLAVSPLERFTAAQAAFLVREPEDGEGKTAAALDELRRKNSFISYDEENGTFSLHSLFRQYLREEFGTLPEERRRDIHTRNADWFIRENDALGAMEASYAAGDFERALTVIEGDMSRTMVTEKAHFFVELFRACPEPVLERHIGAAFKYAIAAFSAGNMQAFGERLAWLCKRCAALPPGEPGADTWRGELEFLLSLAAYNDIEAMSRHHRRANVLLGRPTVLFGPESPWTLGCPSVLFMFHRESGKLDEELRLMQECLPHYYTLASMHGAGGEYLMDAEALYNAGKFRDAAIVCHQARAMARAHAQLGNVICALFLHMRLALAEGNFEEAKRLVREMRSLISASRDYFLLHTVDLCEGHLYAALGHPEEAPEWLQYAEGRENFLYAFAGGYYYIVHGKILLAGRRYVALIGLFAWLLKAGPFANHLLLTIHAHIYTAAASAALGRTAEAGATLRTALDLALPDKLYMPFAENADFLPHLKSFRTEKAFREGVTHILRLASSLEKARNNIAALYFSGGRLPLTKRERQLAHLAMENMSYKDIAAFLGLAPSTVKRAFIVIYKKLGINSRDQLKVRLSGREGSGWSLSP